MALTTLLYSGTGIVGSNSAWIMRVCQRLYVFSSDVRGNGIDYPSSQGATLLTLSLQFQWGETVSLWNRAANGPIVHPPDDTWVNMEQRWKDAERENRMTQRRTNQHIPSTINKDGIVWDVLKEASEDKCVRFQVPTATNMNEDGCLMGCWAV
jgi:hypothetical protein